MYNNLNLIFIVGGNSSNAPTNINLKKMIIGSENQNDDKDKDKDKIEIKIDKDNFAKIEGYEPNFISDNITKITGSLKGKENISKLSYKIISATGNTMSSGDMDIQEKWTINDFKFSFGENTLTVIATDKQDKTYKDEIKVYSIRMANIRDILQDNAESQYALTNDTDEDGIPDFMEMQLFLTDPFKKDSDENGTDDGYEDADEDGLTNLQEIAISLNPVLKDTDGDGLTDGDELNKYSTNPFDPDSDRDGATDKWELDNGYDPKVAETSFDIVKKVEVDDKIKEVKIELNNVSGKTAESLSISEGNNGLVNEEVPGYISTSHDFEADGDIKTAKVTYTLDSKLFENKDFSPALYYFNEKEQRLELVKDQKLQGNIIIANLTHFSKYILIDKTIFDKVWEYTFLIPEENDKYQGVNAAFLIDTSDTMEFNDKLYFLRKSCALDIIDKMTDKDMATIISFDDNPTVLQKFTSDKERLRQAVDTIDNIGEKDINSTMKITVNQFKNLDDKRKSLPKYIFFFSDGSGCGVSDYVDWIKEENITMYIIPVGSEVLELPLREMAQATGGVFFDGKNMDSIYKIFQATEKADLYKDSDGDGIKDYYEKEMDKGHLRLGTGIALIGTDYLNKDSDGDGLLDGEEVKVEIGKRKMRNTVGFRALPQEAIKLNATSNSTKKDSDGDGLLDNDIDGLSDNSETKIDGKVVLPKDPDPLNNNGPRGIWETEFHEVKHNHYATTLGDEYDVKLSLLKFLQYKLEIAKIMNEDKSFIDKVHDAIDSKIAEEVGSKALMFKRDEKGSAIHSQVKTWQWYFGYNDIYDVAFWIATRNMRREKFKFNPNGEKEQIIWTWRGDYINLGTGAEIGMYENPLSFSFMIKSFKDIHIDEDMKDWVKKVEEIIKMYTTSPILYGKVELVHWLPTEDHLPMTLSLYEHEYSYTEKNKKMNKFKPLFLWRPTEPQWWITGFTGNGYHTTADKLVVVGTIDFSGKEEYYEALKRDIIKNTDLNKYILFDDNDDKKNKNKNKPKEKKVWIVWWDKNLDI